MEEITTEHIILSGLCLDETYTRQVASYIKEEYFHDDIDLGVYKLITNYFDKYNSLPNKTILLHELSSIDNEKFVKSGRVLINNIFGLERPSDRKWLLEQTETFCREKATYNAVLHSISVFDGTDKTITPNAVLDILHHAISISFDTRIGMDLIDDAEEIYDLLCQTTSRITFDIETLNRITNGGIERKKLHLFLLGVNCGKTMSMCHLAASYVKQGYNVVYFTLEMPEKDIARNIHGNLLNIGINDFESIGKEKFLNRIEKLKAKSHGKLKIKEFGSGTASTTHFRNVLDGLKTKKNFTPDVILIDYLGEACSATIKASAGVNTNTYQKAVAQEFRALGFDYNAAVWSACQLNRTGMGSTDFDMTDISDSIAVTAVADLILGGIRTDSLDELNQVLFKQLKNRYGRKDIETRFVLGVDLEKQQLFDVNSAEQDDIIDDKELFRNSTNNTKNKFSALDN